MNKQKSYEEWITGLAVTFLALLLSFGITVVTRLATAPIAPQRVTVGDGFIQVGDRGEKWRRKTWQ